MQNYIFRFEFYLVAYNEKKKNNHFFLLYKVGNIKIYDEKKKEKNIFLIRLRG